MIRREAIVGLILVSMVACTESSAPEIPGLDPSEEVELVEKEPAPSDDSFVWTHAVQVGHYPSSTSVIPPPSSSQTQLGSGTIQRIISVSVMPREAVGVPSKIRKIHRSPALRLVGPT